MARLTQVQVDLAPGPDGLGGVPLPPAMKISDMLTVWRRLNVERDSMGPPGDDGPNGDVDPGNLPDASIALMVTNYRPAYIEVLIVPLSIDVKDDALFVHNLALDDTSIPGNSVRDTASAPDFWRVQVFTAYEGPVELDFDPHGPGIGFILGRTQNNDDGPCNVYWEVIRDVAVQAQERFGDEAVPEEEIVRRVVFHETLHRFGFRHPDDAHPLGIGHEGPMLTEMNVTGNDAMNRLTPNQIDLLRRTVVTN